MSIEDLYEGFEFPRSRLRDVAAHDLPQVLERLIEFLGIEYLGNTYGTATNFRWKPKPVASEVETIAKFSSDDLIPVGHDGEVV